MESLGNFFDEEWHSLSRMFIDDEGSDLFVKQGLMSSQYDIGVNFEIPNIFMHSSDESSNSDSFVVDEEHLVNVSNNINPNFYQFFSQDNSVNTTGASNDTISLSYPRHESFPFYSSNDVPSPRNDMCDQSIKFRMMNEIHNSSLPIQVLSNDSLYLTHETMANKVLMENSLVQNKKITLKRKLEAPDAMDDEGNNEKTDKNPKKRSRVSRENKSKKNVQTKKKKKVTEIEDGNDNPNVARNGQSSSSCSSNDDLNASQDLDATLNPNGKTRASRGTATDPQSLYARKRRERINERLRILQNLVPNGTKVDISTMLEEAVEYVKFLKIQIQLLSSDDKWMYAPIAYNGMDMGLYKNIAQTL